MRHRQDYTFSQVPRANIPRSVLPYNFGYKTTFNAGLLVPFYVDEALPGDTFNIRAALFARLATPVVPIMDNLYMDVFFFAVPNRLVWDNWQRFCGEQTNPGDSTDYLIPQITSPSGGFAYLTLYDYMGIPPGIPTLSFSALPFRAYALIWNEWFRDQNLQQSIGIPKGDGPDSPAIYKVERRGKRHDYFTSCLPWPQKGPGVSLPLGTSAPVLASPAGTPVFANASGTTRGQMIAASGGETAQLGVDSPTGGPWIQNEKIFWGNGSADIGLFADLSTATVATINSLREAFQIQKLLERDARGGTRYVEILKSHFGVVSPDARLQRPEFLGGGSVPVTINPVMQTSGTAPDPSTGYSPTPQGNLAAYGVAGDSGLGFTKSFVEHSIVIGLVSVRADLTYQYGLNRMWSRRTRFDFYWPALAHLGEQPVYGKEIFATGVPGTAQGQDDYVFGYQERWAEYRYHPSLITGRFRSTDPTTMHVWHLSQEMASMPSLGVNFIEENPPIDRVIAVDTEPHFLFDAWFSGRVARPMPLYSVPGMIDHF